MRLVITTVVIFAASVGSFYGAIIVASESGEVVTLETGPPGETVRTRLWIVDHEGSEWVRTGHREKAWFRRIGRNPRVNLERAGSKAPRRAVPVLDPQVSLGVNAAFAQKYGAADWIVALSGDASNRIVVRLDPRI